MFLLRKKASSGCLILNKQTISLSKQISQLDANIEIQYQSTLQSSLDQNNLFAQQNELHYDQYLRDNFPVQYVEQSSSLIKEMKDNQQEYLMRRTNGDRFSKFFHTSAKHVQTDRNRQYAQSRERISRPQKQRLMELNNYKEVAVDLQAFNKDNTWRRIKSRIKGFSINDQQRNTIFDQPKNASLDERRYNNFNTKNFTKKTRVPLMDKQTERKPMVNNMDTPLVYYDNIQQVYQKITFGETMEKCLFDYAKSARKEKSVIDLKAELTVEKKPPPGYLSRAAIRELVRKQEIIDHNIERMRNRLAINRAYPVPLFKMYMPRGRPSSQQQRWVKGNSNYFEGCYKKEMKDLEQDIRNREFNKTISPSDWKRNRRYNYSYQTSPLNTERNQLLKPIAVQKVEVPAQLRVDINKSVSGQTIDVSIQIEKIDSIASPPRRNTKEFQDLNKKELFNY